MLSLRRDVQQLEDRFAVIVLVRPLEGELELLPWWFFHESEARLGRTESAEGNVWVGRAMMSKASRRGRLMS